MRGLLQQEPLSHEPRTVISTLSMSPAVESGCQRARAAGPEGRPRGRGRETRRSCGCGPRPPSQAAPGGWSRWGTGQKPLTGNLCSSGRPHRGPGLCQPGPAPFIFHRHDDAPQAPCTLTPLSVYSLEAPHPTQRPAKETPPCPRPLRNATGPAPGLRSMSP